MAITDAARRHHEELFPGHVSTLATTDPGWSSTSTTSPSTRSCSTALSTSGPG